MSSPRRLYRAADTALIRAAVRPVDDGAAWPDLVDLTRCRSWLREVWGDPDTADAICTASADLAAQVDRVLRGAAGERSVRRAVLATARYLLRSSGRPTPFGLFAGVAPVAVGGATSVRWGSAHRAVVRADTAWLADVLDRLEADPDVLGALDVVWSNLVVRRADRWEAPVGRDRATVRHTAAVDAVRLRTAEPTGAGLLADELADLFGGTRAAALRLVHELVRQRFLITSARAPFTEPRPLLHLLAVLSGPELDEPRQVQERIEAHNAAAGQQARLRADLRGIDEPDRTRRFATDLSLDAEILVPRAVVAELEAAADVLLRTTRAPTGPAAWTAYHRTFVDRYGTGTLVPLCDVVHPDAGLGYPADPPSPATEPFRPRDRFLLGRAWAAGADGTGEILLSDADVDSLTGHGFDAAAIPPHVELAARLHAVDAAAVDEGRFTLTVAPARAAGTLTSRFTSLGGGAGLVDVYRSAPPATDGALRVQLSFGAHHPHAENIVRVPRYLDHVLPLGEHRPDDGDLVTLDDLAVTATSKALHLVSVSRRQVVEPQVFHALAAKQAPPLAAFLAQLPRAFAAAWYQFDWGQAVELPRLPRVQYGRTVLSPARWRLDATDLADSADPGAAFERWRTRWACPDLVELRDADRWLRLNLNEPVHRVLVHTHLDRHGHAVLTEAAPADRYGWCAGRVHEIAVPLVARTAPRPNPLHGPLPLVRNADRRPAAVAGARWLSCKLFAHPERMTGIVTDHLPGRQVWWLRYRDDRDADHLRLRFGVECGQLPEPAVIAAWADELQRQNLVRGLEFDTYLPETGRYGGSAAMAAAEEVFVADSALTAVLLPLSAAVVRPVALVAAGMAGIVTSFFGDNARAAARWLVRRRVPGSTPVAHHDRVEAVRLADFTSGAAALRSQPWCTDRMIEAWDRRAAAVHAYREVLPSDSVDTALESLLHLHHNRAVGIDIAHEHASRRALRAAALATRVRSATW